MNIFSFLSITIWIHAHIIFVSGALFAPKVETKNIQKYVNVHFVRDNNIYDGEIENFSLPRGENYDKFNFIYVQSNNNSPY